jgi:rfaE bifunctional protein nucleotidyltransferase chain/domain
MFKKKIINYKSAVNLVEILKSDKKVIGLCHGCFDLLHVGHAKHFFSASKYCDFLFVSVTPDVFVNKGPNRPVISESDRVELINHLECVDFVFINDSSSGVKLLEDIKPDFYFKGVEYKDHAEIINANFLEEHKILIKNNGKMIFTEDEIRSTTQIIKKINL